MRKKEIEQISEALKQKTGVSGEKLTKALKQDGFKHVPDLLKEDLRQEPFKPTSRRTKATVRVLLSYDYCHFEESIELTGEDIPLIDIDNARKDCQRLCDKAVGQYKTAKSEAVKRVNNSYERMQLEKEVAEINKKPDQELTPLDKAKIKALSDYEHQHRYDYDDDGEYLFPGY